MKKQWQKICQASLNSQSYISMIQWEKIFEILKEKKLPFNSTFYTTSLKYESRILFFFPLQTVVGSVSAAIT